MVSNTLMTVMPAAAVELAGLNKFFSAATVFLVGIYWIFNALARAVSWPLPPFRKLFSSLKSS